MKKKLWMKIAKYLLNFQNPQSADSKLYSFQSNFTMQQTQKRDVNVEEALKIIKKSNVLKVQDILHMFP